MAESGDTNWAVLSVVRFALAVIVICGHVSFYFSDTDRVTRWLGDLGGKVAVVGFLLVSGYSIAASLETRRDGFYRRRLWRIYPLYLTALLFAFGVEVASGGAAMMPSGNVVLGTGALVALGNFFLAQTIIVEPMAFDGPIWSLAIEVWYYGAAPLLLRLDRRVLLGLLAMSALGYVAPRRDDLGFGYFVFSRMNLLIFAWAWLMGFVLHGARRGVLPAILAVLATALIALNQVVNPEPLAPATILVTFGLVLAAGTVLRRVAFPRRVRQVMIYLGDLSYPLYLIHFPALIAAAGLGLTRSWVAMAVATALSMLALAVVDVRLKPAAMRLSARCWASSAGPFLQGRFIPPPSWGSVATLR